MLLTSRAAMPSHACPSPTAVFLGHPVPFLVITTVIALRLNPSLRNDSFKSVSNSCYCLQNCLRAFGVFVLMECEKCAQGSRCGITHPAFAAGEPRTQHPEVEAARPGSTHSSGFFGASCYQGHLESSLVSLDITPHPPCFIADYLGS